MKNNRYTNWFFAAVVVAAGFSMAACEDEPDKYEVAGGKPILKYVRVPDPAAADSHRPDKSYSPYRPRSAKNLPQPDQGHEHTSK